MEFLKEFLQLRDRANCKSFVEKLSWGTYVLSKCFLILIWDVLRRSIWALATAMDPWITSCAGAAIIYPAPVTLTYDLLTLNMVSESRVTWATSVLIFVFLGLSVLDLGPTYTTDRQTSDNIIAWCLGGSIISILCQCYSAAHNVSAQSPKRQLWQLTGMRSALCGYPLRATQPTCTPLSY